MKTTGVTSEGKVVLLDCTLRDGGYYNQWSYPLEVVQSYLHALDTAKIDVIEIGLRCPPKKEYLGAYAYCSDQYLEQLPLPKNVMIGVMINAKDYLGKNSPIPINRYFQESSKSPVSLVRIAAHFEEISKSKILAEDLKKLGYQVGFNLMQSTTKPMEELTKAAEEISSWQTVDVLYFADSLGDMDSVKVRTVIEGLRKGWKGPLGFHGHDNRGQALNNALLAIENGTTWIDGTILGMGRGAGNAKTEYLLFELKKRNYGDYYPEAVFSLVLNEFHSLKEKYSWGENLLYYLAAEYQIHPSFIQELMSDNLYDTEQVLMALKGLKKDKQATSFCEGRLKKAVHYSEGSSAGTWSAEGMAKDKDVLIVANGPNLKEHIYFLENYIKRRSPFVLSLNINKYLRPDFISAYVVCTETRILSDCENYKFLKKPLIMPIEQIPMKIREKMGEINILDYGMEVRNEAFQVESRKCTIPLKLAAPYALSIALASGANRILLAGFDGHHSNDPRQKEMEEVFCEFEKLRANIPLVALTPTYYSIDQSSLYSPEYL